MLYNGSFSKSIFDVDSNECDEKIYRIMKTCKLQEDMSKKELEDIVFSAIGSYFNKDGYNFQFIHDGFKETVGCHFYTFDPRVMFSDCDILFIRDRVRVHSIEKMNENVDENFVIIQEDELNENHFNSLFDRLSDEVNSGRFSNQSVSVAIKVKEIFISNEEFIDKQHAISRVIEAIAARSTFIYWIVAFGCNELYQYAWSKMTSLEHRWILGRDYTYNPLVKSFFPLAVLGGNLDIVRQLISTGADVNCFSEFWETPLYLAVRSDNIDMVRLLVSNGAKVNRRGWFAMKIPIAITSKKQEITSLILEYDSNQTELHKAVQHNELQNLRSNIRSDNIDSKTKSGWTTLHYAVILNNLEAVKILFHEELPQNHDSYFDFTQDEQESALLCKEPTPKINITDNNGLTAMHLAVINDNIEMISVLLRYKAEVRVHDVFNRTPLHYVNSEEH
ncbi:unnamed protein product [Mytilus edulis]|uniref:Uncharacterized protein n=1 Tax=Mytilus edulis TaxID=6550 RepID=A0A8S3RNV3_MYTED|nr:unnamed protein product [Mytilus edulis]